jgi:dTMP kinase
MGGVFIALEGVDGSGTTHQTEALANALSGRGHRVVRTREPSDGSLGRIVRQSLAIGARPFDPTALALLFAADRADHLEREIRPALRRENVVVCDRYVLSSWIYQSLECDETWVRHINAFVDWPDRTFVLEVPAAVAMARIQGRGGCGDRFEVLELQERLAAGYRRAIESADCPGLEAVDGDRSPDLVTGDLLARCLAFGL